MKFLVIEKWKQYGISRTKMNFLENKSQLYAEAGNIKYNLQMDIE